MSSRTFRSREIPILGGEECLIGPRRISEEQMNELIEKLRERIQKITETNITITFHHLFSIIFHSESIGNLSIPYILSYMDTNNIKIKYPLNKHFQEWKTSVRQMLSNVYSDEEIVKRKRELITLFTKQLEDSRLTELDETTQEQIHKLNEDPRTFILIYDWNEIFKDEENKKKFIQEAKSEFLRILELFLIFLIDYRAKKSLN